MSASLRVAALAACLAHFAPGHAAQAQQEAMECLSTAPITAMALGSASNGRRTLYTAQTAAAESARVSALTLRFPDSTNVDWDSAAAPSTKRQVLVMNSDGSPIALDWQSLDDERKRQLGDDEVTMQALRNGAGMEQPVSITLVGAPNGRNRQGQEVATYSAFAEAQARRKAMIYAAAADGSLRALDASSGAEVFTYIPSASFLAPDAVQQRRQQKAAIEPPAVGDAIINNAWRTVLVSGLSASRSIVALDVTNPATFASAESNPSSVVLWEFADADLGVSHSRPVVAQLRSGKWVAIFGNGQDRARTTANGKAVLFVVDIATGSLLRKIEAIPDDSGAVADSPNGLSTPAAVDIDGDRRIEYVYAGDAFGNLWKFDLSEPSGADWKIALSGRPLFRATDSAERAQPILMRPEVARGPRGMDTVILFGAGGDATATDIGASVDQTFYGVIDAGTPLHRTDLRPRKIAREAKPAATSSVPLVRIIDAATARDLGNGWYLDLLSGARRESFASEPALRDSRVVFLTQVSTQNRCGSPLTWAMVLDPLSGDAVSTQAHPSLDVSGDGLFDEKDRIALDPDDPVSAFAVGGVAIPAAAALHGTIPLIAREITTDEQCAQYIYLPGAAGGMTRLAMNCRKPAGRQTWNQLR
ncbi:outer membrane protein assembly factor BamB [Povalibacter uvarum]|uniref:Outer membrane protein assembly factor BamB n=1 Tax=Povalibacter uvarum TaxID=732238 RepID=A0A841HHU8_9GAMM|nr:PilC/PilY family type IV pilus protein [Povalibacter uvarum]MBB6091838.1 outer membrane protein assembly factor BamB [Povalibacter uvarum]